MHLVVLALFSGGLWHSFLQTQQAFLRQICIRSLTCSTCADLLKEDRNATVWIRHSQPTLKKDKWTVTSYRTAMLVWMHGLCRTVTQILTAEHFICLISTSDTFLLGGGILKASRRSWLAGSSVVTRQNNLWGQLLWFNTMEIFPSAVYVRCWNI